MKHHTITLYGGAADLRIPADVLVELVSALKEGAMRAARFLVDGESVRKGQRPSWLDAVGNFDVTGLKHGSAVLELEAPSLAEAVPERFGADTQIPMFTDPTKNLDTGRSAIDLLGAVLASTLAGDRESIVADRALLEACARLARIPKRGFGSLVLDGIDGATKPIALSASDADKIELLRDETPAPRAVRLTGTLDTISLSITDVLLRLKDGTSVTARVERHDPETLRALFAKQVVISGPAQFRPSGRLLVIDAEFIGPATEGDALWEQVPVSKPFKGNPVASILFQDESTGVPAFFGTWPGDESDEELLAALAEIR